SPEAQVEASVLMLASHNILSPASGQPITVPTQDMVLGLYYLTKAKPGAKGEGRAFANTDEVQLALEAGEVETLTPIRLRYTGEVIDLTQAYDDQDIGQLVNYTYLRFGLETTVTMLDKVKEIGFRFATKAGLSIGIDDMVIPD